MNREVREDIAPAIEDISLLKKISSGSEAAMKHFFERHHQSVYAYALRRLDNHADAADVLNDVMLQVWRGAERFAGNSKVTTWLLGIANHKILDLYRQRGRARFEELNEQVETVSTDVAEFEIATLQDATLIKHCMEKLSEAHRSVVHLAFFEDMPYPEIAEVLDCPPGTVKTRIMHAKSYLKRCLAAFMTPDDI